MPNQIDDQVKVVAVEASTAQPVVQGQRWKALLQDSWEKTVGGLSADVAPISFTLKQDPAGFVPEGFLVVVDPISTGANVAAFVNANNYPCVRVNSHELSDQLKGFVPKGLKLDYATSFDEQDSLELTVAMLREVEAKLELKCTGVIAGSEPGVALADKLSEAIGVTTNGTKLSTCRRNKYLMGERVRDAGLRAVVQKRITKFEDVDEFIERLMALEVAAQGRALDADDYFTKMMTTKGEDFKAILKPLDSAGSDGVYLCHNRAELKAAYDKVVGHTNLFGAVNAECLVQEFLGGTEYVVDTVSSNGVHKVAAVWAYEKKMCNGAPFVYFAMRSMDCKDERIKQIIDYQFKVLDALGVEHGPGHAEVKFYRGEPVLVEVGNRPQGLEGMFIPVADACFGYNQAEMTVDAYLNPVKFASLPTVPVQHNVGAMVTLVSYEEGVVRDFSNRKTLQNLASFYCLDVFTNKGEKVAKTVDVMTVPGVCSMIHSSKAQLEADISVVRGVEDAGLFDLVL